MPKADQVNSARILVTVPPKLREQVEEMAKNEEVSLALIARRLLRRGLEATCNTPAK